MGRQKYLDKIIVLHGNGTHNRRFRINKKISEGASVICYQASNDEGGTGVLKEFYPKYAENVKRMQDGCLKITYGVEEFRSAQEEYVQPYILLRKAIEKNPEMASYFPAYEIYNNYDKDDWSVGTVYIWTPEYEKVGFDAICREIRENVNKQPEHSLVMILNAIKSLSECVCGIHIAGLLHGDIKPDNFGFIKRGGKILTETVSLFDINSITDVCDTDRMLITKSFYEPEDYLKPTNQSDIYSIGATLYNALIIKDNCRAEGCIYTPSEYDNLDIDVDNSLLVNASDNNSDDRLKEILKKILKKCLSNRNKRYKCVEELIEDLDKALFYAVPLEIARNHVAGKQWVLKDIEEALCKYKDRNYTKNIQYHLYEKPLFSGVDKGEDINVIIIGFGNYCQKFLDICLQAGQIREHYLKVSILTDNEEYRSYLAARKALPDYFTVNGATPKSDNYGNIEFVNIKLPRNKENSDISQLKEYIRKIEKAYIFISLGDEEVNKKTANLCKKVCQNRKVKINAVVENNVTDKDIDYLYINREMGRVKGYREIERMAFNLHLLWERGLNIDYKAVKKEYNQRYNHDACITNIIALKYKLYSIGIDLDKTDYSKAALEYYNILNEQLINELTYYEHRRWVTEKICSGYINDLTIKDCVAYGTKDVRRKRHICVIPNEKNQLLRESTDKYGYDVWDGKYEKIVEQLDPLDKMSVQLHREYQQVSVQIHKQNIFEDNNIKQLSRMVCANLTTHLNYIQWITCMKSIWNGDKSKVPYYKGLKGKLISSIKSGEQVNQEAIRLTEEVDREFYPVVAALEYVNYKDKDRVIIENIPFILTFTENLRLIIPYQMGSVKNRYGNIAAALKLNPKEIIYIGDESRIADDVEIIKEFAAMTGLRSEIKIMSEKDIATIIKDKNTYFEINDTIVSKKILATKEYNILKTYKYDKKTGSIYDCKMLEYVSKQAYFDIKGYMTLSKLKDKIVTDYQGYVDYSDVINLQELEGYENFVEKINAYDHKNSQLFCAQNGLKAGKIRRYSYILPYVCKECVLQLVEMLKEDKLIEKDSNIRVFSTGAFELEIVDAYNRKSDFDALFSRLYKLMGTDYTKVAETANNDGVAVFYDDLIVRNLKVSDKDIAIITELEKKSYITGVNIHNKQADFSYANWEIKHILMDYEAGKIMSVFLKLKNNLEYEEVCMARCKDKKGKIYCITLQNNEVNFFANEEDEEMKDYIAMLSQKYAVN